MSAPAPAITPELRSLLRAVKLGQLLPTLPERLTLARAHHLSHAQFLELILSDEVLRGVDLEDVGDTDLGDVLVVENPAGRGLAGLGGARGVASGAQGVAVTSVMAAQAAMSDWMQRLLTVRGRPRLVSWIRVIASSENRVSLPRPARARWWLM